MWPFRGPTGWKGRWALVLGGPVTGRGPLCPRLADPVQGLAVGETCLPSFSVCPWHPGSWLFPASSRGYGRVSTRALGWEDQVVVRPSSAKSGTFFFPASQDQLLGPSELALRWAAVAVSCGL